MKTKEINPDFEQSLISALKSGSIKAFGTFYRHNEDLFILTCDLVHDPKRAALVVDQLFERLWMTRTFNEIEGPIDVWLYKQVMLECGEANRK